MTHDPAAWLDDSTHLLTVTGLLDENTGQPITDADPVIVTAEIYEEGVGTPLTGSQVTLDFIPQSDGDWKALLPASVPIEQGRTYKVKVLVDGGSDFFRRTFRRRVFWQEA